jgi:multiple sugar transport system substrate-binding protein
VVSVSLVFGLGLPACGGRGPRSIERRRLSLMVPATERPYWARLAESFQAAHAGVAVELVEGPNATDLRENLYTAALLAGDASLDLVYMDVTWTPKLAGAGWLLPLDEVYDSEWLDGFLPAAVAAGRYAGRLYRIPMRTDVGLLYYRRDLLEAARVPPPRTFEELVKAARTLQAPPGLWGFVWQGGQYEGLVCNFLEVLHGHGGFWVDADTLDVGLDRPEALAALRFLRGSRGADPISPPGVTTYKEEESRRLFQDGRAVFLRNWSYVWRLVQAKDSPVAGKVGVQVMVHAAGAAGGGTLGGWGLGVSRYSHEPELAHAFVRHATSLASQRAFCAPTGYAPARRDAYEDPELLAANPFLREVGRLHREAVPRPAIPRYALASDVLQRHLSAALSGLATPDRALREAARETRLLLQDVRRGGSSRVPRAGGSLVRGPEAGSAGP